MANTDQPSSPTVEQLKKLKRKRATQRGHATRFINAINNFGDSTDFEELEHCKDRLQEILQILIALDESVQDLLGDEEYTVDAEKCEELVDGVKRAVRKADRIIKEKHGETAPHTTGRSQTTPSQPKLIQEIKLPTIKLEPFAGNIETWSRFWEQFESSVDKNPSVSTINKHVFLRGYLEGEPKRLVDGIAVTEETYEQTKEILRARYGDKNRIIQSHLDYLEALQPAQPDSPEELNATYVECHRRIQSLKALGEDIDAYGRVLAPKLLRAFPSDICCRWLVHAKREGIPENSITRLLQYLNEEVDGAVNTQKIRGEASPAPAYIPTAAAFQVSARPRRPKGQSKRPPEAFCAFCETKGHWAQDCRQVTNTRERIEKLKASNRCFLCLNRGHAVRQCTKKGKAMCTLCKGSHHKSICGADRTNDTAALPTNVMSVSKIDVAVPNFTYLQTARVRIIGPTGLSKITRCVLDSGSQTSFVSSPIIDSLKLDVIDQQNLAVSAFESSPATSNSRRLVRLDLRGIWTNFSTTITAFESAYKFLPQPTVSREINGTTHTPKLQFADPREQEDLPIEILIGGDHYWKIVKDSPPLRISPSLVLLPSKLGWILSGNRSGVSTNVAAVNLLPLESPVPLPETEIKRFWDLETIGITPHQDKLWDTKDSAILQAFHDSFRIEENRRVVSLPKKGDVPLPNNRQNAETRFKSLETRLKKNADLHHVYHTHMLDYIQRGQVEVVGPGKEQEGTFYLPHHAVSKGKRGDTKWRIVFDASSHERGLPSLNDTLEMGPNLLPEILATLVRFRLNPAAIVGDIHQAFLQLQLDENDRDLTRFLWYRVTRDDEGGYNTTEEVICYRFTRLPFGLTCSPFLLSASLRELATMHKDSFPTAAALVDRSTFMDDFAAGAEDENGVITIYYQLTALMRKFSFPLGKWASNSESLKNIWRVGGLEFKSTTQVLGVNWDTVRDTLFIDPRDVTDKAQEGPTTKRQLLQATSRFYDPLGLMSPVLITGKLIFQDSWCRGVEWDELLPDDLGTRWRNWVILLHHLLDIHIPRWTGTTRNGDCQIHVFCDASERAYGAVLYIRSTRETKTHVQIVCSKNRLAPLKKVTLPRLELIAALVGARLLNYFCKETGYDVTEATLWSDSTVSLGWIRNDPNRWKTFVGNRVTEIHTYTTPSQWKHCPGEDNPADYLSRGVNAEQLKELRTWWHGPTWLSQDPHHWPRQPARTHQPLPDERTHSLLVGSTDDSRRLIESSRFSSYWKLLRVTAWVLRFVRHVKRRRSASGELEVSELMEARTYWIREVQRDCFGPEIQELQKGKPLPRESPVARFNPFLDDGVLRIGGRLQFADLARSQMHPILLHGSHHFTALLIMQTHIRLHHLGVRIVLSELREEFWILRARQAIKKVLHTCLPCKIVKNPFGQEREAPLPAERVTASRPFQVTGIDFAGPLYVKGTPLLKQCYIALFTCATIRAVHLELCSDMTTDTFLLAFQRFIGRRGLPHTIYTDNAQTFHAANRELAELWDALSAAKTRRLIAQYGIRWKFIAPRAAWWGGWWERMVGTTKRCLRKVLGRSQATDEELATTLVNIEAALNSRPITQDTDDALTPAHFLCGERLTALPSGTEPQIERNLTKAHQRTQKLADDFWKRWEKEYLLDLRNFHEVSQPNKRSGKVRAGDIVLLQEDRRPRHMWKKARVEELKVGRDGAKRTAVFRGANGTILVRPIQLVIPLEVDQGGEDP